jgi:hypothetical protein
MAKPPMLTDGELHCKLGNLLSHYFVQSQEAEVDGGAMCALQSTVRTYYGININKHHK